MTGIAFGMAPTLQLPLGNVHSSLKSSGRGFAGDRRGQWTRNSLVVSEVALACVLIVAAGLLARSFFNVLDVDLGFRPQMVASVRVDPGKDQRQSAARFVAYVNELLDRTRSIPVPRMPAATRKGRGSVMAMSPACPIRTADGTATCAAPASGWSGVGCARLPWGHDHTHP